MARKSRKRMKRRKSRKSRRRRRGGGEYFRCSPDSKSKYYCPCPSTMGMTNKKCKESRNGKVAAYYWKYWIAKGVDGGKPDWKALQDLRKKNSQFKNMSDDELKALTKQTFIAKFKKTDADKAEEEEFYRQQRLDEEGSKLLSQQSGLIGTAEYAKRLALGKGGRRKRGAGVPSNNPAVAKLMDLFYKPPPDLAPVKSKSGFGEKDWGHQIRTIQNALKCYMSNMKAHKGMSREKFIATKAGMFSNPDKRKKAWDSCIMARRKPVPVTDELIVKYIAKHGFDEPKYVKPPVNMMAISSSPVPTADAMKAAIRKHQNWSKDVMKNSHYGGKKSRKGGKTRRRKRKKKSRKSKKKRKQWRAEAKDLGLSIASDYIDSWGD